MPESARRTKRRYAHELYPLTEGGETRALAVEVPALYAYALGLETWGSGWYEAEPEAKITRIGRFLAACRKALLADALLQGLAGQEAWEWADRRSCGDNAGEWAWERAIAYGVNPARIKPYPYDPKPQTHDHMASTGDVMGLGIITRIACPESECPICTEPASANDTGVTLNPQGGHTPASYGAVLPSEEQNRFSNDVGEDRPMTKLPSHVEFSVSVTPDWPTFVSEMRRMADAIEAQAEFRAREATQPTEERLVALFREHDYERMECHDHGGLCDQAGCHDLREDQARHYARVVLAILTEATLAEYLDTAKRAERRDDGHECGHTFRIQVSGRVHSSGVVTDNQPTHSDANWWHDDGAVEVRAHNLRDALLIAATLPITDWPGLNEGEETDHA